MSAKITLNGFTENGAHTFSYSDGEYLTAAFGDTLNKDIDDCTISVKPKKTEKRGHTYALYAR